MTELTRQEMRQIDGGVEAPIVTTIRYAMKVVAYVLNSIGVGV